jgi:hypothetical protein
MFSEALMRLNTELVNLLGNDTFLASTFNRKVFAFYGAYPRMSSEDRCALCRFALLEEVRTENKIYFGEAAASIDYADLDVGKIDILTDPHKDAVRNASLFTLDGTLDGTLDKPRIYRLLAKYAIKKATQERITIPAHILQAASQAVTTVKTATESTGLLRGTKPSTPGCCVIA